MSARFDGGRLSSDGGVLLLREIEAGLDLADVLSLCIKDERDPSSLVHSHANMIRARMFAIACGYEDCDDLDVLRFDSTFKLACGRLSETGDDLMGPTDLGTVGECPVVASIGAHGIIDDRLVL